MCLFHNMELNPLINCSRSRFSFIDENFVSQHNLPLHKLTIPQMVEVTYEHLIKSRHFKHLIKLPYAMQKYFGELPAFVTQLEHNPLVLGIS